jgi:fucose 4-O-acetylase-like acetyltransferase
MWRRAPGASVASHADASPAAGYRNAALDFVKGSLVVIMVLYHWLNYFIGLNWDGYRYLRFLTPSFIFITGFLISHVYLAAYDRDRSRVQNRLVQRGVRLLVLFGALNLVAGLALQGRSSGTEPASWAAIFVSGDGRAAFSILVPIGYFLILAPAVLALSKRASVPLAAFAAAAVCATVGLSFANAGNAHLEMLSMALVGLAAGTVDISRIDAVVRRPAPLVLAYGVYVAAITVFNAPFALQLVGVSLSVLLLYMLGRRWQSPAGLHRSVVQLGKYSLFAYVAQIAVLQVLRRGLRGQELAGAELAIPFVAALLMTVLAVQVMALVRQRSTIADSIYRAVFA